MSLESRLAKELTRAGLLLQNYYAQLTEAQLVIEDILMCEPKLASDGINTLQIRDFMANVQEKLLVLRNESNSNLEVTAQAIAEIKDFSSVFALCLRYVRSQPISAIDIESILRHYPWLPVADYLPAKKAIANDSKLVLEGEAEQQHEDAAHVRSRMIEVQQYAHHIDAERYNLMLTLEERSQKNQHRYALPRNFKQATALSVLRKMGMEPVLNDGKHYYVPGSLDILSWDEKAVNTIEPLVIAIVRRYSQFLDFRQICGLVQKEFNFTKFIDNNRDRIASVEVNNIKKFNAAQFAMRYERLIFYVAAENAIRTFSERYH